MNTNHVTQVVAGYAHDADDLRLLLDALGLTPGQQKQEPYITSTAGLASTSTGANHGTYRGYLTGCRCPECRMANTANKRKSRDTAKQDPARANRAGHGKANTYKNYGCRCAPCKAANREWYRQYRSRKREAVR